MKKAISVMTLVLFSLNFSYAQMEGHAPKGKEKPDPTVMTNRMLKHLSKDLKLSDEQGSQMRTILQDFHKAMPETHQKGKEAMEALSKDRDDKVKKVLTDAQYESYLQIMFEMREKRQSHGREGGERQGPPRQ